MEIQQYIEREDMKLRQQYDNGEIDSDRFLSLLFNSEEADRLRRDIMKENQNLIN